MANVRNYNSNAITWFVLVGEGLAKVGSGGSHSFRGYTDHANAHGRGSGAYIQYVTSKNEQGRDVGKFFTFDESRRRFQVRETEQDVNQISQYDFLRFAPDCEGSPNGSYVSIDGVEVQSGIMYRELNTAKDATAALEAESRRAEAQSSVLKLDPQTLLELGAFIGAFGEADNVMKLKVLDWAGKRPVDYFNLLNAGDRALRALVRKSLADGIFVKKGEIIYWADTMIGASEDLAITTLAQNPQMFNALSGKVELGTDAKIPQTKKRPGRKPGTKINKPTPEL